MVTEGKDARRRLSRRLEESKCHWNDRRNANRSPPPLFRIHQIKSNPLTGHRHVYKKSQASSAWTEAHPILGRSQSSYLKRNDRIHQNAIFLAHNRTDTDICAGGESGRVWMVKHEDERHGKYLFENNHGAGCTHPKKLSTAAAESKHPQGISQSVWFVWLV